VTIPRDSPQTARFLGARKYCTAVSDSALPFDFCSSSLVLLLLLRLKAVELVEKTWI